MGSAPDFFISSHMCPARSSPHGASLGHPRKRDEKVGCLRPHDGRAAGYPETGRDTDPSDGSRLRTSGPNAERVNEVMIGPYGGFACDTPQKLPGDKSRGSDYGPTRPKNG